MAPREGEMSAARARNRAQQEEDFRQEEAEYAAAEVPERGGHGRGSLGMRSASGRERPSLVRRPLRTPSPETGRADTSSDEGEGDEVEIYCPECDGTRTHVILNVPDDE